MLPNADAGYAPASVQYPSGAECYDSETTRCKAPTTRAEAQVVFACTGHRLVQARE